MKKVDPCIFCDEAPCVCNQKTKKPRNAAKPVIQDKPDKQVKPDKTGLELPGKKTVSFLGAMKHAAESGPSIAPPPRLERRKNVVLPATPAATKSKPRVPEVPDEELVMNAAIRNLAPLLHWKEQERYAAIISSKPHPHERRAIWKMRRRHGDDEGT